jgi:hypothetical protein
MAQATTAARVVSCFFIVPLHYSFANSILLKLSFSAILEALDQARIWPVANFTLETEVTPENAIASPSQTPV